MPDLAIPEKPPSLKPIIKMLGGSGVLKHKLSTRLDAHELQLRGLPAAALTHLMASFVLPHDPAALGKAIGMSLRTMQRRKSASNENLSPEQSGRTWKFAEILARATAIFGSREEAEAWLERPAIGLGRRRPIDLLATTTGAEIVETHLGRIEYGVYA